MAMPTLCCRGGKNGGRTGLSLLELLMVVTIIGLLASLILPRAAFHTMSAKERVCRRNVLSINQAAERFFLENAAHPSTIADLNTVDQFPQGIPACPVDGSAYSLNAVFRVDGHQHDEAP
jgi:general secretion pathway protein G